MGSNENHYSKASCGLSEQSCSLDPVPTFILKEVLDVLLPFLTHMCNASLSGGQLSVSQRHAIITPLLKKSSLDPAELKNYRPVSNLTFMSKIVEKQVSGHLFTVQQSDALLPIGISSSSLNRNGAPLSHLGYRWCSGSRQRDVTWSLGSECCLRHGGSYYPPGSAADQIRCRWWRA